MHKHIIFSMNVPLQRDNHGVMLPQLDGAQNIVIAYATSFYYAVIGLFFVNRLTLNFYGML